MAGSVSVADCEKVQTDWFRLRATTLGGSVRRDGHLLWTDGSDGLNLMFPHAPTTAALRRGLDRARDLGRPTVGVWLGAEDERAASSALAEAGFQRGWSPWWMVADLSDVPTAPDPRVTLAEDSDDYRGEYAAYRDLLAVTRLRPPVAWYAAAHDGEGRHFAGHAWSYRDGALAGVFDMAVWPPFRRRGLGTALLGAVCAAARDAGATHAVLNATPEGKRLYETCGFRQVGEGVTWWWHAPAAPVEAARGVGGDA